MKRVYVGGRFLGLEEHRRLVKQAINDIGMDPILPEDFGNDLDLEDEIRDLIGQSDIFITMSGLPHGWFRDIDKWISIFQKEYDIARKRSLPCFIFMMSDSHPISSDAIPPSAQISLRMSTLQFSFLQDYVVNFFDSAEDLKAKVIIQLSRLQPHAKMKVVDEITTTQSPERNTESDHNRQNEITKIVQNQKTDRVDEFESEIIRIIEIYEARRQVDTNRVDQHDENAITVRPVFPKVSRSSQFDCDVFVIMPFSDNFTAVFTDIVKPVAESLNLIVKRGDDFTSNHHIMDEVWFALYNCKVIIADCTGNNPNVFYELGIAHTLGRPVIMIAQDVDKAPFDVKSRRFIKYEDSLAGTKKLETQLEEYIRRILNNMDEDENE